MKQKIFLTSVIAMGFVAPAMAEPSNTDTFPQSGLMQEDYTYTNAATSTNMAGVYEGTVNAVAQYTDNLYQLVAGQYLPANSETPIDCDQNGYFCPGDNNGVYYSSSAQGLTQCPSGYGNSGTGASANTDCYRTCSTSDVAHSTGTVNGGVYYNGTDGDGTKTCEPTNCVAGWHVNTPTLMTVIGASEAGAGHYASNYNGTITKGDSSLLSLGYPGNNGFIVDYGDKGIIKGHGLCSSQSGSLGSVENGIYPNITTETTLTDESADTYPPKNCYCQLDSYTPYGDNTVTTLSGPWMFVKNVNFCQSNCSEECAKALKEAGDNLFFRVTMFSAYSSLGTAMCEANTITINWTGTSETEINANNAGTATYGSDIRTPRSATPVPGKTFTGWRFSAPQQASVEPQGD